MAFPTTAVIDTFNRADSADLGVNWTPPWFNGSAAMKVITNQAAASVGTGDDEYWNAATFGPDTETFITIATLPPDVDVVYIGGRVVDEGLTTMDCYYVILTPSAGPDTIQIFRVDNGVSTQLGANISQAFANGDALGLEIIGSTITAYRKPSGGAWAALGNRTDATYSAAGRIAIGCTATTTRLDDFGGGTVVSAVLRGTAPDILNLRQLRRLHPGWLDRSDAGNKTLAMTALNTRSPMLDAEPVLLQIRPCPRPMRVADNPGELSGLLLDQLQTRSPPPAEAGGGTARWRRMSVDGGLPSLLVTLLAPTGGSMPFAASESRPPSRWFLPWLDVIGDLTATMDALQIVAPFAGSDAQAPLRRPVAFREEAQDLLGTLLADIPSTPPPAPGVQAVLRQLPRVQFPEVLQTFIGGLLASAIAAPPPSATDVFTPAVRRLLQNLDISPPTALFAVDPLSLVPSSEIRPTPVARLLFRDDAARSPAILLATVPSPPASDAIFGQPRWQSIRPGDPLNLLGTLFGILPPDAPPSEISARRPVRIAWRDDPIAIALIFSTPDVVVLVTLKYDLTAALGGSRESAEAGGGYTALLDGNRETGEIP